VLLYPGSISVGIEAAKSLSCQKNSYGWVPNCSLDAFGNCSLNECEI